jgi:flagellar biosynthetic protein FliP
MFKQAETIRISRTWISALGCLAAVALSLAAESASAGTLQAESGATSPATARHPSQSLSEFELLSRTANLSQERWSSVLTNALTLGAVGLIPLIALMATCYVRLVIVLGILRQALGGTHTPPAQVVTALALFLTAVVMAPIWREIKTEAIDPCLAAESRLSAAEALERGVIPLKRFMSRQIIASNNAADVWLFYQYLPAEQRQTPPQTFNDVPLQVLLPAFLISELKTGFAIGFQIFLPFLIVDLLVTGVTTSMGMIMLPPSTVSLPLKLALFVMVDGWHLIVGMLLQSFSWVG